MMLPILISVSDAPGSYFFWANALVQVAESKASTAAPNRQQVTVIPKFRFSHSVFERSGYRFALENASKQKAIAALNTFRAIGQ
jgi:hypothetical protein